MAFCGTCLVDDTGVALERNEDGVLECNSCRTVPARYITGPERGYDCERFDDRRKLSGSLLSNAAKATTKITGRTPRERQRERSYNGKQRDPGHVIVRVGRYDASGKPIDGDTAWRSLSGQPWFHEVSHLGTTAHYHVFQRPVPVAIDDSADERELEELLEPYRVEAG